jgi:hypothetical protein
MQKKGRKNALREEYDFSTMSGGTRGKYAEAFRAGTNIAILADDVATAFPTDDSVNRALRAILEAAQAISRKSSTAKRTKKRPVSGRRR